MRPATETIPKALLPVAGIPFVDHQLRWLASHGVTEAVLSVGYRGEMIARHLDSGPGVAGMTIRIVDEGAELRGTAGALRLAREQGVLHDAFLVTYGDSFLPIDFEEVWRAFLASGQPALMTVFENRGRWDTSNVIYEAGRRQVVLYDKHHRSAPASAFSYIDYGLSALERRLVDQHVPGQGKHDLGELLHALSVGGLLAGHEVKERFFEVGSPSGLQDLERWIATRS
jgi:NDP-sugar pyrophosphorylase family protein